MVERLQVQLDPAAYLHQRIISIPVISVTHPVVEARALPDGSNNWTLASGPKGGGATSPSPKLGTLDISDGHVHAVDPKLKADFAIDIATRDAPVRPAATRAALSRALARSRT